MTETMNTFRFIGQCFCLKNCLTMKVGNQIDNTKIVIVEICQRSNIMNIFGFCD